MIPSIGAEGDEGSQGHMVPVRFAAHQTLETVGDPSNKRSAVAVHSFSLLHR